METTAGVMSTQEIAERFHVLAQSGNWSQIQDEMFAENAVSIEPANSTALQTAEGLTAIREKGKKFGEMLEDMHSGYTNEPQVAGRFFACAMGMDATMKGMGRMKLDEIALYEVKDGKIVKEQFFY